MVAKRTRLKKKFRLIYFDEFDDPNESFMDFLLDLIPEEILEKVVDKSNLFELHFRKYK